MQGQSLLHEYDDPGPIHPHGFHEAKNSPSILAPAILAMEYRFASANLLIILTACSSAPVAARDPGSPTPVADPRSGPAAVDRGTSARPVTGPREESEVPVRAQQAPLVAVRDALQNDALLGRRVRVSGRCVARGEGRRAGSWTLEQDGTSIEVRGLVPSSCTRERGEELTIFAQIEPAGAGSGNRLLLRLPD